MKKKLLIISFVCCALFQLAASDDDLLRGLDAYSRFEWRQAIGLFEKALVTMPKDRTEVLYWLVMAHASAQNYRLALDYAGMFLEQYPSDERAAEVSYQQGRILHLSGDYKTSSEILFRFIKKHTGHPKTPSAYYWIGENLYKDGAYAEARKTFLKVVDDYPESGKVNDARYKVLLIDQLEARAELLKMVNDAQLAVTEKNGGEKSEVREIQPESKPEPESEQQAQPLDEPKLKEDVEEETADKKPKRDEEIYDRLKILEEKIDALSAKLIQTSQEQEEKERNEAMEAQQAEEQEREKREKELKDLQQRTRALKKIYEQRVRGGQ